ncbi:MAG: hydantoinase/oxoprolinase family protein [Candidatus Tectomicrobia bacterium]|nr:hydantoinase/oxoprolinase family protein [Candidatus Tectomicrobia bacterium]
MYRMAIDVGGTCTDGVVVDSGGAMHVVKVPSTPANFVEGFVACLDQAAEVLRLSLDEFLSRLELLLHGTTITTNALLTGAVAKTGLITTKGFRDILELRRGARSTLYNYRVTFPPMLAPRHLRLEVEERVLSTGDIMTPLREADVYRAVEQFKAAGVEAVAVSFLFSFRHPEHEQRVAKILAAELPEAYVSISSEVLPRVGEYERTSTTVVNAAVGPPLRRYLDHLEHLLRRHGFKREPLIMQSNGGVLPAGAAWRHAVGSLLSGPSAAIPAALLFAATLGTRSVISVDMGGTSFDVALVNNGHMQTTMEKSINHQRLALPMLDIHTIGAGGGSIAWVDAGGLLHVGPHSAGADPGPACYGRGGADPTVTDANLVLGYINQEHLLGGAIRCDRAAAAQAIGAKVAEPLGISVSQAAHAVATVVNHNMADAIRLVSVRRGHNPKEFVLCVAGGAGPAHAAELAKEVGVPRVLIPKTAAAYSALGMLHTDLMRSYVETFFTRLENLSLPRLNELFERLEREGVRTLQEEGTPDVAIEVVRSMDMRYLGQIHQVEVPAPPGRLTQAEVRQLAEAFHRKHHQTYTFSDARSEMEIVDCRVLVIGRLAKPPLRPAPPAAGLEAARKPARPAYFAALGGYVETAICDGALLGAGSLITGPAIIEETAMSVVIPPDFQCTVDRYGNYLLSEVQA